MKVQSAITPLRKNIAGKMRGHILNCGAGDDLYSGLLQGSVIALDLDWNTVQKCSGLKVAGDIAQLPFRDACFDSVWACAVVEHIREDTIPEMVRVTKGGGQIAVLTPNRYSPRQLLRNLCGNPGWWGLEGHVRLYSYGELRKYGRVFGEDICRFGWLKKLGGIVPFLGRTLMLHFEKPTKKEAP